MIDSNCNFPLFDTSLAYLMYDVNQVIPTLFSEIGVKNDPLFDDDESLQQQNPKSPPLNHLNGDIYAIQLYQENPASTKEQNPASKTN